MRNEENVFMQLGFSGFETSALEHKADLHDKILEIVEKESYNQKQLSEILGQPQPRVSELLAGKIHQVSIEKLLYYLKKLGAQVSIQIKYRKRGHVT